MNIKNCISQMATKIKLSKDRNCDFDKNTAFQKSFTKLHQHQSFHIIQEDILMTKLITSAKDDVQFHFERIL